MCALDARKRNYADKGGLIGGRKEGRKEQEGEIMRDRAGGRAGGRVHQLRQAGRQAGRAQVHRWRQGRKRHVVVALCHATVRRTDGPVL
jgi:hypothetical protein